MHPMVMRVSGRLIGVGLVMSLCGWSVAHADPGADALTDLSLEELSNLEVTSVSKSAELLKQAPASIYVITHEEIIRSGVNTVSEALRLAPNLQITQYSASRYIAGARGFAGAQEAQNFSNKLLILIDGRSVYSPLYSGVYLDVQDVLMDDIDRIEVISGPGATLWGANAMNGVINIITRPAYLTDSPLMSVGYGNQERTVSARFGKKVSEALSFRVYGKAFEQDQMELADGSGAGDDWNKGQLGFRMDWTGAEDSATVQGDAYRGNQHQLGANDGRVEGANVLGRWQHRTERSEWQVQAYFDRTERAERPNGVGFELNTLDLELQNSLQFSGHRVIWGAGARVHDYDITNSATLLFEPHERTLHLGNAFAQDTIALTDSLDLTIGLKMERDPFSGWNPLPDVRLAWRSSDNGLVWLAASRAIRSPTPFDRDVVEKVGGAVFLTGNNSFDPEQVDSYELGYRVQPTSNLSLSASVFYNVYDDLRTIEPTPGTFVPLSWDNLMEGDTYGFEAWAKWQVTDWWRLAPGVRLLRKSLEFSSGASTLLGVNQSGNDPKSQALLSSSMDLGPQVTFDATFRYVDALPGPKLDPYYELNASVAWHVWRALDISLSGFNLLDSRHLEYPAPSAEYIRRSVIAQARWRF
ncbi:MAG: TonB-dependent receptor plug domain-containing protein [Povalibacter sp.]